MDHTADATPANPRNPRDAANGWPADRTVDESKSVKPLQKPFALPLFGPPAPMDGKDDGPYTVGQDKAAWRQEAFTRRACTHFVQASSPNAGERITYKGALGQQNRDHGENGEGEYRAVLAPNRLQIGSGAGPYV